MGWLASYLKICTVPPMVTNSGSPAQASEAGGASSTARRWFTSQTKGSAASAAPPSLPTWVLPPSPPLSQAHRASTHTTRRMRYSPAVTTHPRSARPLRATLSTAIDQSGLGLHSGRPCRARISPAPPGHGVCFNGVPATIDHVVDGHFATTLQGPSANGSRSVRMVEHLLAALALAGIDDADIAVEGGEVPILDGSAAPWLAQLGSQPHPGTERSCVTLTAPIYLAEGDASISAWPAGSP
jgi:hypothetical protein